MIMIYIALKQNVVPSSDGKFSYFPANIGCFSSVNYTDRHAATVASSENFSKRHKIKKFGSSTTTTNGG